MAASVVIPEPVVDSLAVDVPAAPDGFVWLGRMLKSPLPRRGLCLTAALSGGGDIGGDGAIWYSYTQCTCTCMYM